MGVSVEDFGIGWRQPPAVGEEWSECVGVDGCAHSRSFCRLRGLGGVRRERRWLVALPVWRFRRPVGGAFCPAATPRCPVVLGSPTPLRPVQGDGSTQKVSPPRRILNWMAILDDVKLDLNGAMRAGEKQRVGALRMILSELQKASKEGSEDELAVLRRERKRRLEAARTFREAGRDDLAAGEEAEGELIAGYLPAELSEEELGAIVERAVTESGAQSPKDMGTAMKSAMAAVDGRADGKRVSGLVRAALEG